MALGQALGNIVGGVLGGNAAKMDRAHQKDAMRSMIEEYKKIGYPPDYAKALVLDEFVTQGIYTPELEQDLNDTIAEVEQASAGPDSKLAQMQALGMMKQQAKVGLSAEDRAALNQVRQQSQTDIQAKQGQIVQEMQARGMGGSGAELIARMQQSQAGAQNASSASDAVMAQAQNKALAALAQSGDFAGNMRQQEFNESANAAAAKNERNRFLLENSIKKESDNVTAINRSREQDWANKQAQLNKQKEGQREEAKRQATAQQQQYADKLKYAAGITGQQKELAGYYGNQATAKTQQQKELAGGIGGVIDGGANNAKIAGMFSDENLKEHVDYSDNDVQKWLDGLSSKILRKK